MKKPSLPPRRSLLARAALPAAPLALVALPSARAQIVYTDPTDLTIAAGGSLIYIDLGKLGEGGSASLTNFGASNFKLWFGYNTTLYGGYPDYTSYPGPPSSDTPRVRLTGGGGYTPIALTTDNQFARRFASGESIDGGAFVSHYGNSPTFNYYGSNNANWPADGTHGYFAVRLPASSGPGHNDYAWIQISYNADKTITLYDFAYESSGDAILAGDTGASSIPEPAATAAFAALLAGSAALYAKRRRSRPQAAA